MIFKQYVGEIMLEYEGEPEEIVELMRLIEEEELYGVK